MTRGRKKNKIEEVEKPRGFDRGLEFEKIVGSHFGNGEIYFLVKWQNCTELDLMTATELNQRIPEQMVAYHENHSNITKRFRDRMKMEARARSNMELMGKTKASDTDFRVEVKVDQSADGGNNFTMTVNKQEAKSDGMSID
ncbi:uncharacterized protein LOC129786734 [Lutzomyia longipalpis]|uniref:uncharacterized protein LOC129786734 n=1 Tax=Lutzomyia longipalpis TaxID=7200 RepID=UPI002483CD38|nr:uncharacterized protein LOC129786734 [Lutzomyia longipalpis]